MFQPTILQPEPDRLFATELRVIDPQLRVVWGYERYLKKCWTIERRLSPERFHALYRSLLEEGGPRFIDQPIFDQDQPIWNEDGEIIGHAVIGYRRFDLTPEWEWVMHIEEPDGSFRPLDARTLLHLRRLYAWNFNHPISRAAWEAAERRAAEAKEQAERSKTADIIQEGVEQAWYDFDKKVTAAAQPQVALAGTEL